MCASCAMDTVRSVNVAILFAAGAMVALAISVLLRSNVLNTAEAPLLALVRYSFHTDNAARIQRALPLGAVLAVSAAILLTSIIPVFGSERGHSPEQQIEDRLAAYFTDSAEHPLIAPFRHFSEPTFEDEETRHVHQLVVNGDYHSIAIVAIEIDDESAQSQVRLLRDDGGADEVIFELSRGMSGWKVSRSRSVVAGSR